MIEILLFIIAIPIIIYLLCIIVPLAIGLVCGIFVHLFASPEYKKKYLDDK